ncbi:hypothetical protein AYK24_00865 [Thermoplasmatales archaeon SG8-52-4]|nr:MAG: hypothetical protein AYK24_00865 [Thermoplasmatales archaeon SG8-52-4]
MKGKILVCLVSMLFFTVVLPINTLAGDEENPEIKDVLGDVKGFFVKFLPPRLIQRIDINYTWFYETPDDPENLKIIGKLDNVVHSLFFKTFYSVYWIYNDHRYVVTMVTRWYNVDCYVTDLETDESHMAIPLHDGDSDIFGFIIHKDLIGNPKPGDILIDPWASAKIGFGNGLIFNLANDRAPDTGYGLDYTIQY